MSLYHPHPPVSLVGTFGEWFEECSKSLGLTWDYSEGNHRWINYDGQGFVSGLCSPPKPHLEKCLSNKHGVMCTP